MVKAFVETANEAELPDALLSVQHGGKTISEFTDDDFKAVIRDELDQPAFSEMFKDNEEEKNRLIDLFAASLKRGVMLKTMSDGFSGRMQDNEFKADTNDMERIESFLTEDRFVGRSGNVRDEMAKVLSHVDTRTLGKNNLLNLISRTAKGMMFFNSTIDANLKVQETEIMIEDNRKANEAIHAASEANWEVYNSFPELTEQEKKMFLVNYNKLDNEDLLERREETLRKQKRMMQVVGSDFEQTVFYEDVEKVGKELKQIEDLERKVSDGIWNHYSDAYKKLDRLKNCLDIKNPNSPFYVPKELAARQKSVDNPFAETKKSTVTERNALHTYLANLNNILQDYGYQGKLTQMPNKEQRIALAEMMEKNARKDIANLERAGLNRKAFDDPDAFLDELKSKRSELVDSDTFQRSRALEMAKDYEMELIGIDAVLKKRAKIAPLNQKALDAVAVSEKSLDNSKATIYANSANVTSQMAHLYDRLSDKENPFHINTSAFRKMKNIMERFKKQEDYLMNDDADNYAYHMQKGAISGTEDEINAMQEAHDAAQQYLAEKAKQDRKNPSEMRLARLETANEIVKLTEAYLKAHRTLEENEKGVKEARHDRQLESGTFKKFEEKAAVTAPEREKPVIPTLKHRQPVAQKAEEKVVEEKKAVKESNAVDMGALH